MGISTGRHGREDLACSDVNAGCVRLQHRSVVQAHTFLFLLPRWTVVFVAFSWLALLFLIALLATHGSPLCAKQRPSRAEEGILLIGISLKKSFRPLNHCITHGTWDHARRRALTPAPLI